MAPVLSDLIGQYLVLETLASYLSTLDLFHLGLTCRDHHACILSSTKVFQALRRDCLCDGRGLRRRQDAYCNMRYIRGFGPRIYHDEEIEVKLFAAKCDETGALPCLKCGINICEECRECPRVLFNLEDRRPHLDCAWQIDNVMCLCDACDAKLEEQLRGRFLSELCDCDRYRRWICSRCVNEEKRWTSEYYKKHTVSEVDGYERFEENYDATKVMTDHQFEILLFCTCRAPAPEEARPRCTWCKRKHRPEEEWSDEMREVRDIPFDDGCYPIYDPNAASYPRLAYNGPIYQGPPRNDRTGSEGML
ncbi:hypothetical protein F5X99DRAFT_410774 [Biscogniauxia marginata]|nr:hypothetical protein F5X99DRAFT_410774 [Biscogniauxia marginata]